MSFIKTFQLFGGIYRRPCENTEEEEILSLRVPRVSDYFSEGPRGGGHLLTGSESVSRSSIQFFLIFSLSLLQEEMENLTQGPKLTSCYSRIKFQMATLLAYYMACVFNTSLMANSSWFLFALFPPLHFTHVTLCDISYFSQHDAFCTFNKYISFPNVLTYKISPLCLTLSFIWTLTVKRYTASLNRDVTFCFEC